VARASIDLPSETEIVPGQISSGENLASLLRAQKVSSDEVEGMLASLEGVFDARRVRDARHGGSSVPAAAAREPSNTRSTAEACCGSRRRAPTQGSLPPKSFLTT
jgi:hypothetical protein